MKSWTEAYQGEVNRASAELAHQIQSVIPGLIQIDQAYQSMCSTSLGQGQFRAGL
jgi:hypothetical protein